MVRIFYEKTNIVNLVLQFLGRFGSKRKHYMTGGSKSDIFTSRKSISFIPVQAFQNWVLLKSNTYENTNKRLCNILVKKKKKE